MSLKRKQWLNVVIPRKKARMGENNLGMLIMVCAVHLTFVTYLTSSGTNICLPVILYNTEGLLQLFSLPRNLKLIQIHFFLTQFPVSLSTGLYIGENSLSGASPICNFASKNMKRMREEEMVVTDPCKRIRWTKMRWLWLLYTSCGWKW